MNTDIIIENHASSEYVPDEDDIHRWVSTVLQSETLNDSTEICIRLVNQDEMANLNQTYRQKDGPTNVLSFPFDHPPGLPFEEETAFLGDIVICPEVLEREASEQNKPLEAHWAHIAMHGALHLLGYDHQNELDSSVMENKEIKLLKQLGWPNPYQTKATA